LGGHDTKILGGHDTKSLGGHNTKSLGFTIHAQRISSVALKRE